MVSGSDLACARSECPRCGLRAHIGIALRLRTSSVSESDESERYGEIAYDAMGSSAAVVRRLLLEGGVLRMPRGGGGGIAAVAASAPIRAACALASGASEGDVIVADAATEGGGATRLATGSCTTVTALRLRLAAASSSALRCRSAFSKRVRTRCFSCAARRCFSSCSLRALRNSSIRRLFSSRSRLSASMCARRRSAASSSFARSFSSRSARSRRSASTASLRRTSASSSRARNAAASSSLRFVIVAACGADAEMGVSDAVVGRGVTSGGALRMLDDAALADPCAVAVGACRDICSLRARRASTFASSARFAAAAASSAFTLPWFFPAAGPFAAGLLVSRGTKEASVDTNVLPRAAGSGSGCFGSGSGSGSGSSSTGADGMVVENSGFSAAQRAAAAPSCSEGCSTGSSGAGPAPSAPSQAAAASSVSGASTCIGS
mmetsp:Transcript_25820/g.84959  ORF Transcript_25820/g.84959 Transcript_25820/m.84959 type:complete len:437 (+) Transcript_25820:779-2089(+)